MNEKSNDFLSEFLKPIKETDDNLSIRLSILFTLKHLAPEKFQSLELDKHLDRVIAKIGARTERPPSLRERFIARIKGIFKQKALYDLQARLDYWYYTKLLGHEDTYRVDDDLIKTIMTDDRIRNVSDPGD
ncbi:MAG: hypothetical protein JRI75_05940, partial [Deltaproteobacteria bacterium]|nr:hypothetical protein [Deltaproteobacteria bacterium]